MLQAALHVESHREIHVHFRQTSSTNSNNHQTQEYLQVTLLLTVNIAPTLVVLSLDLVHKIPEHI